MRTNDVNIGDSSPASNRKGSISAPELVRTLRARILAGEWEPGIQLPTWSDMEAQLNVGRTTLAKAVRQLKRDGFVFSSSTRGTFVSARPPHLYRYALAFRGQPDAEGWVRFWWALANEATTWNQNHAGSLVTFFGVAGSDRSPSHQRLLEEVEADRLAGVIFVGHPPEISQQLLNHPWLAKVAICGESTHEGLARVYPDRGSFIKRSLEHLRDRGCRSVAVVTGGHPEFAAFDRAILDHGMTTRSFYRIAAALHDPDSARNIVHLLLDRSPDDRPDALIITDDNLVDSAMAGVRDSGIRVGENLQLVAHCNWPQVGNAYPDITRLGFNAAHVLRQAVTCVESLRRGEIVLGHTHVPAIFEHELTVTQTSKARTVESMDY
ncbi:MAG: GntR family transcriptional regulator [Phycisphaerales bacterium]|nr:GntR family transcriptional regulator [Phycisphaerales bacterium]